jgi:sulfonate transport system permease protein
MSAPTVAPAESRPDAVTDPSPARARLRPARLLIGIWAPVALFVLWWVLSANSTSPYFPPLQAILEQFWTSWVIGEAKFEVVSSLSNLLAGFAIASVLGIGFGVVLWRLPLARRAANPVVYFLYVLPAPALLPAMIAILGVGTARQVALIAFGALWPVLLNTIDGLRGINEITFDTARAMNAGGARTLRIALHAASPQIAAGLRAALQVSLILMVVSEMVASTSGIGHFILQSQQVFAVTSMWTGILALVILGTTLNALFVLIERRVLAWHHRSRALAAH